MHFIRCRTSPIRSWTLLIAFVLFCHGFIYIRIGSVLPGPIKEWTGSSWLLRSTVTGGQLTTLRHAAEVISSDPCA